MPSEQTPEVEYEVRRSADVLLERLQSSDMATRLSTASTLRRIALHVPDLDRPASALSRETARVRTLLLDWIGFSARPDEDEIATFVSQQVRCGPLASQFPLIGPKLVSFERAAGLLGVPPKRLQAMVDEGLLQPSYEQGKLQFRLSDIRALRDAKREDKPQRESSAPRLRKAALPMEDRIDPEDELGEMMSATAEFEGEADECLLDLMWAGEDFNEEQPAAAAAPALLSIMPAPTAGGSTLRRSRAALEPDEADLESCAIHATTSSAWWRSCCTAIAC